MKTLVQMIIGIFAAVLMLACSGGTPASPAPGIASFGASRTGVAPGQEVALTAVFSNGAGAIDHGVGQVTSGSAVTVAPEVTTTYTLTVTGADHTIRSQSVTITVTAPPSFSLSGWPVSIPLGGHAESTITVVRLGGEQGQIDLSLTAAPAGITATGAIVAGAGTGSLTINVATSVVLGNYDLVVHGTDGSFMEDVPLRITAVAQGMVIIPSITSFTAAAGTIFAGQSTTLTAEFVGNGVVSGVGAIASGIPVTVTPSVTTTYTLTVTGIPVNPVSAQTTVTVTPGPPPPADFQFWVGAGNVPVTIGGQKTLAVNVTRENGETGTIAVTLSGSPAGMNGTASIPVSDSTASLILTLAPGLAPGVYPITLHASDGSVAHEAALTITATTADAPTISGFTASASEINTGQNVTLTPVFSNGVGTINGWPMVSGTPWQTTPYVNTTYALTVTNGDGVTVTSTLPTIIVDQPNGLGLQIMGLGAPLWATGTNQRISVSGPNSYSDSIVFYKTRENIRMLTGLAAGDYTGTWGPATMFMKTGSSVTFWPRYQSRKVSLTTGTLLLATGYVVTGLTAGTDTLASGASTSLTPRLPSGIVAATIDQGVGTVTDGIAVKVTPSSTTAYTLSATDGTGATFTSAVTITVE